MSRKYTIEFIREQFEKEGYTLLTKKYVNNRQRLEYICPKGHCGMVTWYNWKSGRRCSECFGNKKLTIKFIRKQFKKEDYILVSEKYNNNKCKLEYICPKGHKGYIMWKGWQQGSRCPICACKKKLTIDFIQREFVKDGYTLLTKKYINNKQKLEYVCPQGHVDTTIWVNWQQGHRCKKCYFKNNKGKKHHNWNSNLTQEDRINGRHVFGYEKWSYLVKERDNFTCQICGDNQGGDLVSHHIESYNNNPELRTKLYNGVCLCKECHKDFHHQYGYGNNTRRQFEEFMCVGV